MQDYKSLCTTVTTYATLVVPKLIRTFWPPVTLKRRVTANLVTASCTAHKYFCDRLKPMKVAHCDLLFCVRSGFASESSHAKLLVSVYSGYDLCHPIFPKNLICSFWYLWPRKVFQVPGICCTHVRYTQDPNLVTAGQQVADIMQIKYYNDDIKTQ